MPPWSRSKRKFEAEAPAELSPPDRVPDGEEVELSPLEQRLSTMEWPKPPPGVRERLFDQIVERAEQNGDATDAPDRPGANGSAHAG